MYRRPRFLEALLDIRREMAKDASHDVYLLAEVVRTGCPAGEQAGTMPAAGETSEAALASTAEAVAADTLTPSV